MNLSPLSDVPFGDRDAFYDFMLAHGIAHKKIALVMFANDDQYDTYPLFDTPFEDTDWRLTHQSEHQSIYTLLGLQGLPDLARVDFDDQEQYEDWFLQHRLVHEIINAALGITS